MRVLITGGTGFVGQALVSALKERGCHMVLLSRQQRDDTAACRYITDLGQIDSDAAIDAVVNLAGAPLAAQRWNDDYKQVMRASRLDTTRQILKLMERLEQRPAVLLNASATGIYGPHGDEILTEKDPGASNPGFAQSLATDWEAVADDAGQLGVRTCLLRLGVILDREGGAFGRMAGTFHSGIGSWIGSGRQWFSWMHREDVIGAMLFLLDRPDIDGPVNFTAPEPVTARGFADALAKYYPTRFNLPLPGPIARLLMGEMANELLIHGQRVVPAKLQAGGYAFRYPTLDSALAGICSD